MLGLPATKWLPALLVAAAVAAPAVAGIPASATPRRVPTRSAHGLASGGGGQSAMAASCVGLTRAQQQAAAKVIVIGQMLSGPTTLFEHRRVLLSPARMRTSRYLKGSGPRTIEIETAVRLRHGQIEISEDGILPSPGQRWEILSSARRMPLESSICLGSRRLPSRGAAPGS